MNQDFSKHTMPPGIEKLSCKIKERIAKKEAGNYSRPVNKD